MSLEFIFFKHRKLCMTLIELLIVISVLAIATGVIGININRMLREQHFKTETEFVVDYLRLAQNLMLIMDADVHVNFKAAPDNKSIEMWLEVDNQIKDLRFLNLITQKRKQFTYIRFINLDDPDGAKDVVDVKFLSKGSVMSKGIMRIATNENSNDQGTLEAFICLPGYPKPIFSTKAENDDPACNESKQNDFDFRLTTFTIQEINAKTTTTNPAS
jgi:type II secretory pathway pseudopilin PulG